MSDEANVKLVQVVEKHAIFMTGKVLFIRERTKWFSVG
jgi:hypothetical protein